MDQVKDRDWKKMDFQTRISMDAYAALLKLPIAVNRHGDALAKLSAGVRLDHRADNAFQGDQDAPVTPQDEENSGQPGLNIADQNRAAARTTPADMDTVQADLGMSLSAVASRTLLAALAAPQKL